MAKKEKRKEAIKMLSLLWQRKWLLLSYLFLTIIKMAISFVMIIVSAKALEALTLLDYEKLIYYGIIGTIIALLVAIASTLQSFVYTKLQRFANNQIEMKISERLVNIKKSVYDTVGSGAISLRVNSMPNEIFAFTVSLIASLLDLFYNIAIVTYIMVLNWVIGLMVIVIVAIIWGLRLLVNKVDSKYYNRMHSADEKMCNRVVETIKGHKDIKCLNLDDNINKEVNDLVYDLNKKKNKWDVVFNLINGLTTVLITLSLMVILYVSLVLYENYFLSYFALIYVFSNYNYIKKMATSFMTILRTSIRLKTAKRRLNQLFDDDLMPVESFGQMHLDNVKGKLEFKNIDVRYDTKNVGILLEKDLEGIKKSKRKKKQESEEVDQKEAPLVLKKFNLKINAGEKIAIVGKSGSGKSTIVSLISRSLVPTKGDVYLDGKAFSDLDEDSIRSNITVINQYPYIYYMSLRDNIRIVKPDATDEEILTACKLANLEDFVNKLPYKLDTMLGENGVKLSGGQKQRVALARAFLRDTPIMVFDESTSSLDNFSQKVVQDNIDKIENRTVIIIAHRLSTIKNCDRIVLLKEGKVEAVGKFEELMKTSKVFADLYNIRVKYEN